jgi:hypothetical protein
VDLSCACGSALYLRISFVFVDLFRVCGSVLDPWAWNCGCSSDDLAMRIVDLVKFSQTLVLMLWLAFWFVPLLLVLVLWVCSSGCCLAVSVGGLKRWLKQEQELFV